MKKITYFLFSAILTLMIAACSSEDKITDGQGSDEVLAPMNESLIICNEGNWQSDNGQLSFYDGNSGTLTNGWFRQMNGAKLGDTPNDILQVNDTLIAIAVNWSNIIQYIRPDGTACGATENVPNNRRMCSDGKYLYVTSYAHKCGDKTFTKGYVAKIDINTKEVVATCEVGWEPEGIRLYNGTLYIANTGGYAFSEKDHEYETTVSMVDSETMIPMGTIDTGCINLYGEMSQAGQYLCINSCGDYYDISAKTVILDCKTNTVHTLDFPCTYNTTDGEKFYTVGSAYSYNTGQYTYYVNTINPQTLEVTEGVYGSTVTEKLKELTSPYELYISPKTKNIYFTDAGSYASAGYLYGYAPDGRKVMQPQKVYINPAHILAVGSNSSTPIVTPQEKTQTVTVVELHPAPGQFVNTLPEAQEGTTHEEVCNAATESLNNGGMVHLGTYGGYVTVKFDHPIRNLRGSDLRIKGNGFYAASDPVYGSETIGGSFEPGIVYVGVGDDVNTCEWYELAGSEYYTTEIHDFSITYYKPTAETGDHKQQFSLYDDYLKWHATWTDKDGVKRDSTGYHMKNSFHKQTYWPLWENGETLTFSGGKLPNNAINQGGSGMNAYWVLYRYAKDSYGYVDASLNTDDYSTFDIDWAVDKNGNPVHLTEVNFIKVVSGVFQYCGWLGETSTEVAGFEDLHLIDGYDDNPIIITPRQKPTSVSTVTAFEGRK